MKLNKCIFLLLLSSLLISCGGKRSNDSESEILSESNSIDDSESSVYQKDEDGFYILEDDYYSYHEDSGDTLLKNQVYIPDLVSGYPINSSLKLHIADREVPVYNVKINNSHTWTPDASSRINNGVASFFLRGKVTLKLQTNFAFINQIAIRPLAREVKYEVDNSRRVLTFEINTPGQYTIELRSNITLHLFVEDMLKHEEKSSGSLYFEKGLHNRSNDTRISSSNTINLSSNATVIIEPGAIIQAKFIANNASNITIKGCGYIDGSIFERNANNGTVLVPIEFNNCTNIKLYDFACIDPAGWCFNMYFCKEVIIDNVKVISSRSNGDGISIQSCQDVNVYNSFIRTWDDSLVVKNYPLWSNRNTEGTTKNINFEDCILWTDLAQSMEIGYETVGEIMEDITFKNITVLHNFHKAVFSIHNGNNANIKNVKFQNITVEDASVGKGDGTNHLIDFRNLHSGTWSDQHKITGLGSVDGVTVFNVLVLSGIENPIVEIGGCMETRSAYPKEAHYINNVSIAAFSLYGHDLDENYQNLKINQYTNNIHFDPVDLVITGAEMKSTDTSGYGNNIVFY